MFYPWCFFFYRHEISIIPAADRREILPHDRKLAEFYNTRPKISGGRSPPPKKKIWDQNMRNVGQFLACEA